MRVLLVEDEPDLGVAVQRALNREKYVVDWVQDGDAAWAYLESNWTEYTVAVFDWLLPGLTGLELCQRLRARQNPLPILMLTAKDSMADKVTGLDAGADDYLVKPFGMAELLARLRALQRRAPQFQQQQLQVGPLTLDYGTSTVALQPPQGAAEMIPLTAKEFQLLEYFMQHPQQIVTRNQLMNQLWEVGSDPVSNVVAAQIRLLRRKLTDHGCDHWIETVYGLGYRLNLATQEISQEATQETSQEPCTKTESST
ncbi:MAG: two-component system response regulator RppA [Elainella sp.]